MTTTSNDDGFREIQLNGKQLVFLFMAVTVVLVVTFLTGVLVGRGVRAERAEAAQAEVLNETPEAPPHAAVAPPVGGDPTQAAPPSGADESADAGKPAQEPLPAEEPPVAVTRNAPAPAAAPAKAPESAKADNTKLDKAKPASPEPTASKSAAAKPAPAASTPAPAASTPPAAPAASPSNAPATVRNGYAVQVAAVNARGEADSIVKRLSGKGYAAYVEDPRGSQKMFRVRVGTFKTRSEAQSIAERLKREEKFAPWVTR